MTTSYNASASSPSQSGGAGRKVISWLVAFLLTLPGYWWVNGGQWQFCTGEIVRWLPPLSGFCPQPLKLIPPERVDEFLREQFQPMLESNLATDEIYASLLRPGRGRTADQEMAMFRSRFEQKDHVEYLGELERVGQTNTFVFNIEMYKTIKKLTLDQRESYHQNARYGWKLTMDFEASDPAFTTIWGDAPDVDVPNATKDGIANAPEFTFVGAGHYYQGPGSHEITTHPTQNYRLPAICLWAPDSAKNVSGTGVQLTDMSKVWVKTLYGWVRLSETEWIHDSRYFSNANGWPTKLFMCVTDQ